MKKYIFTESQVKRIMDGVVEEQLLTEQTAELNAKKTIQCFLNKVVDGCNLAVDGLHGQGTEEAIRKFQDSKGVYPTDGIWGPVTGGRLSDSDKKIMSDCRSETGDIIDKFLNWLGL